MVVTLNIISQNQIVTNKFKKKREKPKKKGFNSAFIVAFKGEKQIKLSEALDK